MYKPNIGYFPLTEIYLLPIPYLFHSASATASKIGAIVGGVVGGLVLLGIIIIVFIIVKCNRRRSTGEQGQVFKTHQEAVPLAPPGELMQIRMIMLQLVVIDASSEQEQQTPVTNFDRPFPLSVYELSIFDEFWQNLEEKIYS